jgi:hypothetical protein
MDEVLFARYGLSGRDLINVKNPVLAFKKGKILKEICKGEGSLCLIKEVLRQK